MGTTKRPQKWFSRGEAVTSSTAPVDHVRLRSSGWAQHETQAAAEAAAKDAAKAAAKAADEAGGDDPETSGGKQKRGRSVPGAPPA